MPTPDDSLFASFERAITSGPPDERALAGVRDGSDWVELTRAELHTQVAMVSAELAALGLGPGDVLCLQLPNWTEAVVYTYAALRLGAVVCPITTIYRQRELSFILERTQCRIVVTPSTYRGYDFAAMARGIADELPHVEHVVCVGDSATERVISSGSLVTGTGAPPVEPVAAATDDLAVLAFTSGTTGESKGVMHSHRSMTAAIDDFVAHAGLGQGLTSLVMSPFGHLTGFTWGILMPLKGGGDVVLLETWNAEQALDLFARYSVSFTMGAAPFLSDLLDAAAERKEAAFPGTFVCAGSPIPPTLIERALLLHHTRVVSGWGMSEYPIGTSTSVTDEPALASTSDGRPAGRADVRIVDVDGKPVSVGEEGDLVIRGPGLFHGYYKRDDLTRDGFTDSGHLKTGDRARLLDVEGHLRISGRTKDLIIRGGENIPVVEIENLLLTHPAIREVALVPVPHERLGETACACVVPRSGHDVPTLAELAAFLRERGVATQFFPEGLRSCPDLPRTPSGKIRKFVLREQVLAGLRDHAEAPA
ncbi:AMP-binding protein [Pedococcus sp. 5OH_020]|uniref:AMP-binding protein n=1 Tax=Pedococcus sp. 5OH_020 TaxID=2989814 RepID=UPI0022E9CB37|nr:AMP-binding protein [Pedococcus sp. 5OH_020]